jgi:hypothetical protein
MTRGTADSDRNDDRPTTYPGPPRWVKLIVLIAAVLLLVVAFVLVSGLGGSHGPQRHGAPDRPTAFDVIDGG